MTILDIEALSDIIAWLPHVSGFDTLQKSYDLAPHSD